MSKLGDFTLTRYSSIPMGTMHLEMESFLGVDYSKLYIGQNVMFIGYPKGFYDTKNFLPIARSGSIASIPSVDFEGKRQLLIDAQVFPGSSGSPVFTAVGSGYKLLGIISEVPIRPLDFLNVPIKEVDASGRDQSSENVSIPIQFIGLGMLFKSTTIQEVADLA